MPEMTTTTSPASAAPSVVDAESTPNAPPIADISDVYGDFDAAERDTPSTPPAQAKPEPSKTAAPDKAKAPATDKAPVKPAADKAPAKTAPETPEKTGEFSNLTDEQYAKLDKGSRVAFNSSLRQHAAKLEERLRSATAELEKVKSTPADNGRVKELESLLEARETRLKEVEENLRMTAYERSDEYKEKFQKPYVQAYGMGRNKAASMKTVERKNDMDEVVQPQRQGTAEDFDAIMRISDDDTAYEYAEKLFGPKALAVMHYRERVQELHQQSRDAIEDRKAKAEMYEKEAAEMQKRKADETEAQTRQRAEMFRKAVDEGTKQHPEWFTPEEGDNEGQKVIDAGKAIADSLFTGINPKTGKPYTTEGMVRFHAFVRNALAAHGHLQHRMKAAQAKVAALEAQLAEFKESSTLTDAGRGGESNKSDGLAGPEEFYEADRGRR